MVKFDVVFYSMKPDSGFEMEEEPYDPRELFADVALLITEARTPDLSKKGRVEGPHCPPIQGSREHDCDRHKEQCRKASDILTQHKILLRNNIPMRVDVLLFPSCEHGLREETVVVGAMFSTVDAFILLERWDIQLINKRSTERHEGYVGGRALLQAVRSYLHFSQLSSWLISTGGALSMRVVYRVYAPGETVDYSFERIPEVHNFPSADLGDAMMRATVMHLPRQDMITSLQCLSPPSGAEHSGKLWKLTDEKKMGVKVKRRSPELKCTNEPMPSSSKCDDDYFGYSPTGTSSKRHSKDHMEYGKRARSGWGNASLQLTDRPPSGRKTHDAKQKPLKELEVDTQIHSERDKIDQLTLALQNTDLDLQKGEGHRKEIAASRLLSNQELKISVVPPSSLSFEKSVSTEFKATKYPGQLSPQKAHPYKKQTTLFTFTNPSTPFHITKRLPSPKVLMTASKKPEPSGFSKRCLDYNQGKKIQETGDDFSTFRQFEELSATEMEDLVRPLSPTQLDTYLSSLSNKAPKKMSISQLNEIPVTKCRFFIGETDKTDVFIGETDKTDFFIGEKDRTDVFIGEKDQTVVFIGEKDQTDVFIGENDKTDDVFESPYEMARDVVKASCIAEKQPQDLTLQLTAKSLSEKSTSREDNSKSSSLSQKSAPGDDNSSKDNSTITCLSEIRSTKETDYSMGSATQDFSFSLSEKRVLKGDNSNTLSSNQGMIPEPNESKNSDNSSTTPEPQRKTKYSTRILFHKSLSTSEVDDDTTCGRRNLKKVINKLKTELKEPNNDVRGNVSHVLRSELDKEIQEEMNIPYKNVSKPSSESENIEYVAVLKHSGLKTQENQNFNNASIERKTPVRDKLDDLTIPCTVGSGKVAMTNMICDIESSNVHSNFNNSLSCASQTDQLKSLVTGSMDVDSDKLSVINGSPNLSFSNGSLSPSNDSQSLSNGSSTPVSGSPNVDDEIKHHMKQSSQRGTSLGKGDKSGSPDIGLSLCKQLLRKEFQQCIENEVRSPGKRDYKNLPSPEDIQRFQFHTARSASALFNSSTGLPTRSSPAPMKRKSSGSFDYDCSLTNVRAIKSAVSCSRLTLQYENKEEPIEDPRIISTSAPASTNCLLGNFEESMLNGRIEPVGVVDGFTVEIGAGGSFCPKHVTLPVAAYFFQLSDDNAPSPYLGHVNLDTLGKRGYHIPRRGTVQVTLFNPNRTVVKMFVVMYDLSDMPASCQTFLRQRTMYMPVDKNSSEPSFLRYLIHLRFASTKSGKIYLHTDIRLIFARDKFEFDPRVANYELRSFTEGPENPKFSPKR